MSEDLACGELGWMLAASGDLQILLLKYPLPSVPYVNIPLTEPFM